MRITESKLRRIIRQVIKESAITSAPGYGNPSYNVSDIDQEEYDARVAEINAENKRLTQMQIDKAREALINLEKIRMQQKSITGSGQARGLDDEDRKKIASAYGISVDQLLGR